MKLFKVLEIVPATKIYRYNVEAENEEEAIRKVLDGEHYAVSAECEDNGDEGEFEVELIEDFEEQK